jgi:hypothetical protein
LVAGQGTGGVAEIVGLLLCFGILVVRLDDFDALLVADHDTAGAERGRRACRTQRRSLDAFALFVHHDEVVFLLFDEGGFGCVVPVVSGRRSGMAGG